MTTRTGQQNKALHLWLTQKANQCKDAGVSPKMAFSKTVELEMTAEMMKEIFRTVQKAMYGTDSTKELKKQGQLDEVVEHLNRFFSEQFHLPELPLPSHELGYWESAPMHNESAEPPSDSERWEQWAEENNVCRICTQERTVCGGEQMHG